MQRMMKTPAIEPKNAAGESGAGHNWIGWTPLIVLPATACVFRPRLQPWQFMWLLSIAIFLAQTLRCEGPVPSNGRQPLQKLLRELLWSYSSREIFP
jgi:hypothetical protein